MQNKNTRTERPLVLPIDEVTLLEDRARVLRRGRVEWPKAELPERGDLRLRLTGVSPVLVDKTLTAKATVSQGAGGVVVVDTRVRRERVIRGFEPPARAEVKALDDERDKLQTEVRLLRQKQKLKDAELSALQEIERLARLEIQGDAALGSEASDRWRDHHQPLLVRERALYEERQQTNFAIADLDERVRLLNDRIAALRTTATEWLASFEVDLDVTEQRSDAAHVTLELEVEYTVPCACWRPYHTAELLGAATNEGQARLRWSTDGCVWQRTGEDWTDVQLRFSTERLSAGVDPPLLSEDRLRCQKKRQEIEVEARDQVVHTTGLGAATKTAEGLPGIDDGGVAVLLRSQSRATVKADGQPYRTLIDSFDTDASHERVLMAEREAAVILRTEQSNQSNHPILAGPVDLIRQCGLVGKTSVLFVAPGEKFAVGWGADGALRVWRDVTEQKDKKKMLSAWTTQDRLVKLRLSNIGPEPRTVRVTERIPVSEIDKVKITLDALVTTDKANADGDGFVRWQPEVPAFGTYELQLGYEVAKHNDVTGL